MEALALKSFQFLVRCFWEIEGGCGGLPLRTSLFWKRIIVGKYGDEERGWCSRDNRDDFGVGLWKAIRRG